MPEARDLELISPLGQGGFGTVWLATLRGRDGFSRRVAVKVMRDAPSQPAEIVARQRDEARLLGILQHPNIVQVLDLTEFDGAPAVVMEHVEGADVAALIKAMGALPGSCTRAIATGIAAALDAGWNATSPETGRCLRVIHRDIKPANVLVTIHGTVKVLDFGVARADFDREGRTQSMAFGTPRFMAPEQFISGEVTPGNDIYALAVTMWEMLVGRTWERAPLAEEPFEVKVEAQLALAPEAFRSLLRSMMAWSTRARPSAADVVAALDEMQIEGESLRAWSRRVVPGVMAGRAALVAERPTTSPPVDRATSSSQTPASPTSAGPIATSVSSPSHGSAPPTLSGGFAPMFLAEPRVPVYDPGAMVHQLEPEISLATLRGGQDKGKLAVGAAGALAGMALVAGIGLLATGGWWWSHRSSNPVEEIPLEIGESPSAAVEIEGGVPADPAASPGPAPARSGTDSRQTPWPKTTREPASAATPPPPDSAASGSSPPVANSEAPPITPESVPQPAGDPAAPTVTIAKVAPSESAAAAPTSATIGTSPTPADDEPVVRPTKLVTIMGDGRGWKVYVDDKYVGVTALKFYPLTYGRHVIKVAWEDDSAQKDFDIGPSTSDTLEYVRATHTWTWPK